MLIATPDGAERRDPRSGFRGWRQRLWWDRLDALYFAGYALWDYLTTPFLLLRTGVRVWVRKDSDPSQTRLRVAFPPTIPTHSPEQEFYFDRQGLLTRLDCTAEVFGRWARAVHTCEAYRDFDGLRIPTRRRVVPRRRDGQPRAGPTLVWIAIDEVEPFGATGR